VSLHKGCCSGARVTRAVGLASLLWQQERVGCDMINSNDVGKGSLIAPGKT